MLKSSKGAKCIRCIRSSKWRGFPLNITSHGLRGLGIFKHLTSSTLFVKCVVKNSETRLTRSPFNTLSLNSVVHNSEASDLRGPPLNLPPPVLWGLGILKRGTGSTLSSNCCGENSGALNLEGSLSHKNRNLFRPSEFSTLPRSTELVWVFFKVFHISIRNS